MKQLEVVYRSNLERLLSEFFKNSGKILFSKIASKDSALFHIEFCEISEQLSYSIKITALPILLMRYWTLPNSQWKTQKFSKKKRSFLITLSGIVTVFNLFNEIFLLFPRSYFFLVPRIVKTATFLLRSCLFDQLNINTS